MRWSPRTGVGSEVSQLSKQVSDGRAVETALGILAGPRKGESVNQVISAPINLQIGRREVRERRLQTRPAAGEAISVGGFVRTVAIRISSLRLAYFTEDGGPLGRRRSKTIIAVVKFTILGQYSVQLKSKCRQPTFAVSTGY